MIRTLPLVLLACLCLAGCSRSADPLDWKIKASTPEELEKWFERNLHLMPPELSDEVIISFNNIKANTPGTPSENPTKRAYRICQQIDGHTVRAVLIEGHELANRQALVVLSKQSDMVVRMLADAHTLGPAELKQRESLMNAQLARQAKLEEKLKEGEARVAALRARPESK